MDIKEKITLGLVIGVPALLFYFINHKSPIVMFELVVALILLWLFKNLIQFTIYAIQKKRHGG